MPRARAFALLGLLLSFPICHAQLPSARLNSIFPAGGKIASTFEVTLQGSDLDHATNLYFSHPGIKAKLAAANPNGEPPKFQVKIGNEVPPGSYDVRLIGRFGISTSRTFEVGRLEETVETDGNSSRAKASEIKSGSTINGSSNANEIDHFKFKARPGERLVIECAAKSLDSRMLPSLILEDASGREVARNRQSGLIVFTPSYEGEFVLKVHDLLFRGGPEYFYRMSISSRPQIDFIIPPSGMAGTRSTFQIYGRNLTGGVLLPDLKMGNDSLERIEVEIPLPAADSVGTTRPELPPSAAALQAFEYRLGNSNPALVSFATANVIQEKEGENVQRISIPCEFVGQLYPSHEKDHVEFEARKGEVYWLEVFSHRLNVPVSPFLLLQKVIRESNGSEKVSDVQEIYAADANIGGPQFKTTTLDPSWRFEVKEDATYRVQISNLFPAAPSSPANFYRLSIRSESPDFALVALPATPPPVNRDTRPVFPRTSLLRKGESLPIEVLLFRRDNFSGPVQLSAEGLPQGVRAEPAAIASGSSRGLLFLRSDAGAAEWSGPIKIIGKAKDGDRELTRSARAGEVLWEVGDYNLQPVPTRFDQEYMLGVSGVEASPLLIETAESKVLETIAATKLSIPLKLTRSGQFNTNARFKPGGHPALDSAKDFEIAGAATNATFELDLSQSKLPEGAHQIYFFGHLSGKYSKLTPDEIKAAEIERDKGGESGKQAAERLKTRDVTVPIWSAPIQIYVKPEPKVAKN